MRSVATLLPLLLAFTFTSCNQQKISQAPKKAADSEQVLGSDASDDDSKDSLDAKPSDKTEDKGKETDKDKGKIDIDEKITPPVDPQQISSYLDMSKLEELTYSYKDGDQMKTMRVKFKDSGCSLDTGSKTVEGSTVQCSLIKSMLKQIGKVPVDPKSKCSDESEKIVIKAGGIEQAMKSSKTSTPGCSLPQIPAGSEDSLRALVELYRK